MREMQGAYVIMPRALWRQVNMLWGNQYRHLVASLLLPANSGLRGCYEPASPGTENRRMNRRPSPSDVSDEEWACVAPYPSLLPQTAAQRRHERREVFNAMRSIVRTGAPWRWLPTNFPPWEAVYQQTRRSPRGGVF
jgi:Putative transposase of IS4/5 family (DUF4096)